MLQVAQIAEPAETEAVGTLSERGLIGARRSGVIRPYAAAGHINVARRIQRDRTAADAGGGKNRLARGPVQFHEKPLVGGVRHGICSGRGGKTLGAGDSADQNPALRRDRDALRHGRGGASDEHGEDHDALRAQLGDERPRVGAARRSGAERTASECREVRIRGGSGDIGVARAVNGNRRHLVAGGAIEIRQIEILTDFRIDFGHRRAGCLRNRVDHGAAGEVDIALGVRGDGSRCETILQISGNCQVGGNTGRCRYSREKKQMAYVHKSS